MTRAGAWEPVDRKSGPSSAVTLIQRYWFSGSVCAAEVVEITALPRSLLEAFLRADNRHQGWARLLQFRSPITIRGGPILEILRRSTMTRSRCIVAALDQRVYRFTRSIYAVRGEQEILETPRFGPDQHPRNGVSLIGSDRRARPRAFPCSTMRSPLRPNTPSGWRGRSSFLYRERGRNVARSQ